jgi:Protein of unknown function (DUF3303)
VRLDWARAERAVCDAQVGRGTRTISLDRRRGWEERVRYMVVETFINGPGPVHARVAERGRMLPAGLVYVDSWIDERRRDRCFQLMETEDPRLFSRWIANWSDLVRFEVVPVISSAEAAARTPA